MYVYVHTHTNMHILKSVYYANIVFPLCVCVCVCMCVNAYSIVVTWPALNRLEALYWYNLFFKKKTRKGRGEQGDFF